MKTDSVNNLVFDVPLNVSRISSVEWTNIRSGPTYSICDMEVVLASTNMHPREEIINVRNVKLKHAIALKEFTEESE
jgi:hypothetical protein